MRAAASKNSPRRQQSARRRPSSRRRHSSHNTVTERRHYLYVQALVDDQFADSDPMMIGFASGVVTVRAADLDPRYARADGIEAAYELAAYAAGHKRFGRKQRGVFVNDYVIELRSLAPFVREAVRW